MSNRPIRDNFPAFRTYRQKIRWTKKAWETIEKNETGHYVYWVHTAFFGTDEIEARAMTVSRFRRVAQFLGRYHIRYLRRTPMWTDQAP